MSNRIKTKCEQNLRYNLTIWSKNDAFDILNDISEKKLVQLMDSLVNVNHAISIVGHWIFDSNYKKSLFLTQELFNIICSPSIGEEQVATFRSVFYAVRYIWAPVTIKKSINMTLSSKRLNT